MLSPGVLTTVRQSIQSFATTFNDLPYFNDHVFWGALKYTNTDHDWHYVSVSFLLVHFYSSMDVV